MSVTWTKESLASFKGRIEELKDEEPIGPFKEYMLGVISHAISRELFLEEADRAIDEIQPVRIPVEPIIEEVTRVLDDPSPNDYDE